MTELAPHPTLAVPKYFKYQAPQVLCQIGISKANPVDISLHLIRHQF